MGSLARDPTHWQVRMKALGRHVAVCWAEGKWKGERLFAACAELLSLVPGRLGSVVRKAFYNATIHQCAERAYISFGVLLVRRSASVGHDVYIGPYSIIGSATIGNAVKIASRVSITSGRHQHGGETVADDPRPRVEPVAIGDEAWIGEGAIVMADVGKRCIVGAGSVVVRPVPDGAVVAGNPARPISSVASRRAAS
jgi:acetyltransferase-like isoleucine patch superfamily enzyme